MNDVPDVSSILTQYNISPSLFTDILFQPRVDRIYYYGSIPHREIDGFVSSIPKISETYGLPDNKIKLYEPLQMIKIGCDINAHVDLNYEQYFKDLSIAYNSSNNDTDRTIISRIIGTLKPYEIIELPVFDTNSLRISTTRKPLNERLDDIIDLYNHLTNSKPFREYKVMMRGISSSSSRDSIKTILIRMEEILNELISYASEFSTSLAILLKITKAVAHFTLDSKNEFNPLLINLDNFHKEASRNAIERIFTR